MRDRKQLAHAGILLSRTVNSRCLVPVDGAIAHAWVTVSAPRRVYSFNGRITRRVFKPMDIASHSASAMIEIQYRSTILEGSLEGAFPGRERLHSRR